ncbi:MAG: YraN family protein [Gemmatimonadales bacterium]|nr:YraN family protein [Gemmatimonadales bacterium]
MPVTRRFVPTVEWEDPRHLRGLRGERIALAYLTSCGWQVEAHRYRVGRHDVDLVATRRGVVAFVEVKARGSASFGSALEAIGWRKRRSIWRVAAVWRERRGRAGDSFRFDVVTVVESPGGEVVVEHVADAWRM